MWIFETSKEDKEEISRILSEIDPERINRLKDLGAPEVMIKDELAPVDCDYGFIVDSSLKKSIESILQSLKLKYKILDKSEIL